MAFVPGSSFFARDPRRQCLRLNFSNRTPELIREGMARLGRVVQHAASPAGSGSPSPWRGEGRG